MDILLIDDNPLMQQVVSRFLGGLGYDVVVAGRADEALDLAQQNPPALALIDVCLPDMDGPDALQALRALPQCKTIPAVGISGMDEHDLGGAITNLFSDYLSKPIDLDVLQATVERYISRPESRSDAG